MCVTRTADARAGKQWNRAPTAPRVPDDVPNVIPHFRSTAQDCGALNHKGRPRVQQGLAQLQQWVEACSRVGPHACRATKHGMRSTSPGSYASALAPLAHLAHLQHVVRVGHLCCHFQTTDGFLRVRQVQLAQRQPCPAAENVGALHACVQGSV